MDITAADFNGDDRTDLAIANFSSDDVTILLRSASGNTYQPPGSPISVRTRNDPVSQGSDPVSIASGDFNGDSRVDLAVANQSSKDMIILLGDGAGGFARAPSSPLPLGNQLNSVRAGDFNLDSKLDLAVVGVGLVKIMLGDGGGGFAEAAGSPYAVTPSLVSDVEVKDLSNDGRLDLAITSWPIGSSVAIFLGNGAGGFSRAADVQIPAGTASTSVEAADLNGDDRIDLAVSSSNRTSAFVSIFFGNGMGGFSQSGQTLSLPVSAFHSVTVADFNLDSYPDMAVSSFNTSNATVLLNNQSGGFAAIPAGPLPTGFAPAAVIAEDFNGDGKVDFATANNGSNSVTEYTGNGAGGFAEVGSNPVQEKPIEVAVIDFNSDSLPDLATAAPGSGVVVMTGKGDGIFTQAPGSPFATAGGSGEIETADFNRDNRPDLAVASAGGVSILLRDAASGFTLSGQVSAGGDPVGLAKADFNRDGLIDLAAATSAGSGNVTIMLGNGAGGFVRSSGSPLSGGASPTAIEAGDFNSDGRPDLAVTNQISNGVSILIGDGAGGFASPAQFGTIGQVPWSMAVADFNRDSISDIAVVNLATRSLTVILGDGAGSFSATMDSPIYIEQGPFSIDVGDFDLDGVTDIAVTTGIDNRVRVLLGGGDGSFDAASVVSAPTGAFPVSIAVADFNLDGKMDFATANNLSNDVSVKLSFCSAPPAIVCPSPVQVSHDAGRCSAVVSFDVEVTGVPAPSLLCNPPSGISFPVGTTTVACAASNGVAPDAQCSFTVTVVDDEPPTITTPLSIAAVAEAGRCSAQVTFQAGASDTCSPGITPLCDPPSGSSFPAGATTVNCTATDAAGNRANRSFTITVTDTQAPVITCPQPVATSNDAGLCSATVNFTATAVDNCDSPLAPACSPPSGSSFPIGATTVNCTATDAAGNSANCSFTVAVADAQAPAITCPQAITKSNDAGLCSAIVNFTATAIDNCDGPLAPVCSPPSGTAFPAGVTTVNCSTRDAAGNSASRSFTVTITDTQAPAIACPPDLIAQIGAVNYAAPAASDNCQPVVVCSPPSGSAFPAGVTTVSCTATDAGGNRASCSFTVTTLDICVDNGGSRLGFSSVTGDYLFCCGGVTLRGKGAVSIKGNLVNLRHDALDRRVTAQVDRGKGTGTATAQWPLGVAFCSITDRDIRAGACGCQ
jgi:hypothetical protein